MNTDSNNFSWKGLAALLLILIIVSIIAVLLSSLEGLFAGVIVIFIGLLFNFFRDDLKRFLGLSSDKQEGPILLIEGDERLEKLEKKISKERAKIAKLALKFKAESKSEKKQKIAREIIEDTTALIAIIDQAKSRAIQLKQSDLLQHYETISIEIQETRERFQSH